MNEAEQPVAIVTGGGTGIGRATALELAGLGQRVVLVGRRLEPLTQTVRWLAEMGHTAISEPADVRDFSAVEQVVEHVTERWGRVDVIVANAALAEQSRLTSGDPARWEAVLHTNVMGTLHVLRATLPLMHAQGSGDIVIVASVSGRITYVGEPAYIASKHALVALAEALRLEVTMHGIRVTIVEPALVATDFSDNPYVRENLAHVQALSPEAVARCVRFALEQPREMTISEIVVRPTNQL